MSSRLQIVIRDIEPEDPGEPEEPVIEPEEPVIIPDSPVVPDTGNYTILSTSPEFSSNNSHFEELSIAFLLLAFLLGVLVLSLRRREHRKMRLEFDGVAETIERDFNKKAYLCLTVFAITFALTGFSLFLHSSTKDVIADEEISTVDGENITISIDRKLGTDTTAWTVTSPIKVTMPEATANGYDLYAYAKDGINRLVSSDTSSSAAIEPISDDNLVNVWGVSSNSSAQASALPTAKTNAFLVDSISGRTEAMRQSEFSVYAFINLDLPAGTYVGEIEYFAKPKYTALQNWTGCDNLSIGESVILSDIRDNQLYTVSKYKMSADGSQTACWMSNLNLGARDLTVTELNSSNTNLASGVSAISATTFNSWEKTTTDESDYNPGFIPITASNSSNGQDSDAYGNKYGTLYNYGATSAGTITRSSEDDATSDLCPAGWRLPTGGEYSGEFAQLIAAYGGLTTPMDSSTTPTGAAMSTILQRDLGFSLAGNGGYDGPMAQDFSGHYQSSTTHWVATQVYGLLIRSDIVSQIAVGSRSSTISIRCIAERPTNVYTLTISLGTGVASVEIDGTSYHDGDTISLVAGSSHSIDMAFANDYEFDSWSISGTGSSVASTSTQATTLAMGTANATLTATGKAIAPVNGCTADSPLLQNVASWGSTVAIESTIYAIDSRDNQCYKVTRFKMGTTGTALWMSNLNLGAEDLVVTELNSSNTNLASGVSAIPATTFISWKRTHITTPQHYNPEFIPVTASSSNTGQDSDIYGNKYGVQYTYSAASAMTITAETSSDNATSDLCPAGWRLPTGNSNGELDQIVTAYRDLATTDVTMLTILQQNLGFSLAGWSGGQSPYDQGYDGAYWSSTSVGGNTMYSLFMRVPNTIYTNSATGRTGPCSIRCIAR